MTREKAEIELLKAELRRSDKRIKSLEEELNSRHRACVNALKREEKLINLCKDSIKRMEAAKEKISDLGVCGILNTDLLKEAIESHPPLITNLNPSSIN